jgi:hypothetical protein
LRPPRAEPPDDEEAAGGIPDAGPEPPDEEGPEEEGPEEEGPDEEGPDEEPEEEGPGEEGPDEEPEEEGPEAEPEEEGPEAELEEESEDEGPDGCGPRADAKAANGVEAEGNVRALSAYAKGRAGAVSAYAEGNVSALSAYAEGKLNSSAPPPRMTISVSPERVPAPSKGAPGEASSGASCRRAWSGLDVGSIGLRLPSRGRRCPPELGADPGGSGGRTPGQGAAPDDGTVPGVPAHPP